MIVRTLLATLLASTLLLAGCQVDHPSSAGDNAAPAAVTGTHPLFEPLAQNASLIPFPVDLLFNGSSDATLNIPGVANSSVNTTPDMTTVAGIQSAADPMVALNTMSGFSTTGMITLPFSAPINSSQSNLSQGVRIFQTNGNLILGSANAVAAELAYGVDFVASVSGNTLAIVPLRPLQSATSYIVVVTTGLKDASGKSVAADAQYVDARSGQMSALPQLTTKIQGDEGLVVAYSGAHPFPPTILAASPAVVPLTAGNAGNIALSYSITTQNITAALQQAQGVVQAATVPTIAVGALPTSPTDVNGQITTSFQAANTQIYVGQVSGMTSFLNPADPVHSIWSNNGNNLSPLNLFKPDANAQTVTVPVLVTAPNASATITVPSVGTVPCSSAFPSGYPVVIFQHGITSNRGTELALAGALTRVCAVGIAIDLPEHGILPTDAQFGFLAKTAANGGVSPVGPTGERLVASGAGVPSLSNPAGCVSGTSYDVTGSGAYRCAAGDSYINLANLMNSRDVLRQSVVDLDSLYLALSNTSNVGMPAIDTSKVSFVGMSLGSIVGETFVATLGNIGGSLKSVTFNVGGGGIAKLLDGSPTFEPVITDGLAAQGVTKPSATYESFLIAAQTLVDSADPINYTTQLAALTSGTSPTTPILFQEVVGNGSANAPDQVVPNNVFGTAFGQAWGLVSGSGQAGWLANQNTVTNPAALGGADSLVQGTAFVSLAQALAQSVPGVSSCVTAYGPLCPAISAATSGSITPFTGIGLPQVNSSGQITADVSSTPTQVAAPYGVVRFTSGTHSSLLDPMAVSTQTPTGAAVTTMMQTQIANFIGSANQGSATVVGEAACSPSGACDGTIANWAPLSP